MPVRVANHDFNKCPRCGAKTQPAQAFTGESEFWLECSRSDCNTFINTYIPQPHQFEFHTDAHHITANFGGYGSGKTLTSREELEKHTKELLHEALLNFADMVIEGSINISYKSS